MGIQDPCKAFCAVLAVCPAQLLLACTCRWHFRGAKDNRLQELLSSMHCKPCPCKNEWGPTQGDGLEVTGAPVKSLALPHGTAGPRAPTSPGQPGMTNLLLTPYTAAG